MRPLTAAEWGEASRCYGVSAEAGDRCLIGLAERGADNDPGDEQPGNYITTKENNDVQ